MTDQRLVRCSFCGQRFWTTEMEEPAVGAQWICGECEQLEYFEKMLLQSLVRIGDELFALVEKKADKE